jgi:hypothetical protein
MPVLPHDGFVLRFVPDIVFGSAFHFTIIEGLSLLSPTSFMRKSITVVAVALGLLLIAASLFVSVSVPPFDKAAPAYADRAGDAVKVIPTGAIGGCGTIAIDSITVVPHVIAPLADDVGNSFLVSLRLEILDAHGMRKGTLQQGFSTEVCADIASVSWKDLTPDERRLVEDTRLLATLALAGVEFAPKEPVQISAKVPVYWSVRPTSSGSLAGWVSLSTADQPGADIVRVNLSKDAKSSFLTKIRAVPVTMRYVLSAIGSCIGTLLASLPAWLAWYDKRKGADSNRSKIVIAT